MTLGVVGIVSVLALASPPHDEAIEKLDARVFEIVAARSPCAQPVGALLSREFGTQLALSDPYTTATFSFEHATRDDAALTFNDWDIEYGNRNDSIGVQMVVDDRSRIFDLGEVDFSTAPRPDAAATLGGSKPLDAVKGHVYVVHTVDADTDLWSRFRILEMESKKWIVFEWERFETSTRHLRRLERQSLPDLAGGAIHLEVRSESGGGNPYGVFLDGTATSSVASVTRAPAPLESATAGSARSESFASCDGGLIPEGHVFAIESIEWTASLANGSTGPLEFEYWLGPYRVAVRDDDYGEGRLHTIDGGSRFESGGSSMGKFTGTVVIRPGEETRVAAVAHNGTIARATVTGRLVFTQGSRLPPLPIEISKRDAEAANDLLRFVDEGGDPAESAAAFAGKADAEILLAFLEDALRFRTSDEDRGRIERTLKRWREKKP